MLCVNLSALGLHAALCLAARFAALQGLTVYELLHGSLPPPLLPARGVAGKPRQLSSLLQRAATFNWQVCAGGCVTGVLLLLLLLLLSTC
jgi:hypothetical protein